MAQQRRVKCEQDCKSRLRPRIKEEKLNNIIRYLNITGDEDGRLNNIIKILYISE